MIEKACPQYENVYFVKDTEDCINCYHSEYNIQTNKAHCLFRDREAKLKIKLASKAKEQKHL
jgi:hypothetical protein